MLWNVLQAIRRQITEKLGLSCATCVGSWNRETTEPLAGKYTFRNRERFPSYI
ncbi:MAG: hypothetical protein V7K47_14085 [Nostoc sp.]